MSEVVSIKLAGRYRLEREIARGGMATVWLALDEVLGRPVAVKILHAHLSHDASFRKRFQVEALAAAALTHPNITSVYDTGDHQGASFIVMEYLQGGTLGDQLAREEAMGPEAVASIGIDVCKALAFAHGSGVIHRDIKPANILLSQTGHIKVTDFGIAKAAFADRDLTSSGVLLGTARYLSPEQIEGHEPDPRSDLYSLGIVLYEAVTGVFPFTGQTDLQLALSRVGSLPKSPRDVRPDVPRDMDRAIMHALQPIDRRYQDATAMRQALEACTTPAVRQLATAQQPRADIAETSFVKTEGRLLFQVLLVLVLAAGLVFAVAQLSREGRPLEALGELLGGDRTEETEGVPIQRAGTFDPPDEGGDGVENDDRVSAVLDGEVRTHWTTTWYTSETLGGLKQGVGVYVDLGRSISLTSIEVVSITPGWQASIRQSDDGVTWSPPGGSETVTTATFRFEVAGEHRYWMIWITRLVRTSGVGTPDLPYSVAISEIRPIPPE